MEHDSFGNLIIDSNPSFDLPIGYAGGLVDAETGLVRFGYRDYEPASGRWTARDPLLFASNTFNFYSYAGNDPVNQNRKNRKNQKRQVHVHPQIEVFKDEKWNK